MPELLPTMPCERIIAATQGLLIMPPHRRNLPAGVGNQMYDLLNNEALFILLSKLDLLVLDLPATATLTAGSLAETIEKAIAQALENDLERAAELVEKNRLRAIAEEGPAIADPGTDDEKVLDA